MTRTQDQVVVLLTSCDITPIALRSVHRFNTDPDCYRSCQCGVWCGLRVPAEKLVMVGDRYMTDIVFGNRLGMLTIRPEPFTWSGEPQTVKMVCALSISVSITNLSRTKGKVCESAVAIRLHSNTIS